MKKEEKRLGMKEHLQEMLSQHYIRVRLNDGAELPGWAVIEVEEALQRICATPLIDVWRISDGSNHYYTMHESEAEREQKDAEECDSEIFVTKEKMLREDFDSLPEFMGF